MIRRFPFGNIIAALAICHLTFTPANSQEVPPLTHTPVVASGVKTRIGFLASVNPDCTQAGFVTLRMTKPPKAGTNEVAYGKGFAQWQKESIRAKCNEIAVDGSNIYYVSNTDFRGVDFVEFESFYENGTSRKVNLRITVK